MSSGYLFEEHKGLLVGRAHGVRYERDNPSDHDVEMPPAFVITDTDGATWMLGNEYVVHDGFYYFNVLRNDVDMDEVACKIVYSARGMGGQRRVWLYTRDGWKHFSRSRRGFI